VNRGDSLRSGITNITYSSISGGTWVLLDGVYMSPATGHGGITKARISFTSTGTNTYLSIQLVVSSEQGYDWAFISTLDNAYATYESGYYEGSRISGEQTVTVRIPVPNPGSHFIDIGYQKDGSDTGGYDAAAFMIADSGGSDNMPEEPVKSGYTFGGWYTQRNGGGSGFTGDTRVTGDITVYAWWTYIRPVQHTVTFNADGGSPATQTRTVNSGGSLGADNMPEDPVKSGYTFGGWYTAPNGGGSQFTSDVTVSGDITVYAWWTEIRPGQYTVTFDADGGSPATQTRTVNSGASLGSDNMPGEPAKSGYFFGGWYTAPNGGGSQFTSDVTVSGDITVYAWWTYIQSVQYTVTFDADGGTPATQTRMVNSGASIGSGGSGSPGITNITYSGDTWTLLGDGRHRSPAIGHGSVTKARIAFTSGTTNTAISIQLDVSSESGCDWAFISTLDNASATYTSISGSDSVTVTIPVPYPGGHFIEIGYRKDGSVDSGSDCAWFEVTDPGPGDSGMPVEPEKSGYVFGGWYTQQNGEGSQFTADTRVTEDITLYAWWTNTLPVQYTVTFNADGGSPAAQTRTVNRGVLLGTANMPEEPVNSGSVFGGWYTQQNGGGSRFTGNTPVTADATMYAWWAAGGGASAVRIMLQPAPDDPPLNSTSLYAGHSAEFSAGSGYNSYTWYWDGVVISGANGATYTLEGAASQSSGIHELSVVVADGTGARLSARCRVIIQTP
jgi:uncharacterized repeat protein (TIGR02543 family)